MCLLLSAFLALPPAAWGQDPQPQSIRILVLAGQDAINNVEPKTATQPVVEVQDDTGSPVAGAEVVFTTPAVGPSATFYGATRTTTLTTDKQGRAAVSGMMPNTDLGLFEMQVTATHGGGGDIDRAPGTQVFKDTLRDVAVSMSSAHGDHEKQIVFVRLKSDDTAADGVSKSTIYNIGFDPPARRTPRPAPLVA